MYPLNHLLPPDVNVTINCTAIGQPLPYTSLELRRWPNGTQPQKPVGGIGSSVFPLTSEMPLGEYEMVCVGNNRVDKEILLRRTYVMRSKLIAHYELHMCIILIFFCQNGKYVE